MLLGAAAWPVSGTDLIVHLAEADRHIAEGKRRIERQHAMVERLGKAGHDTGEAGRLLLNFEKSSRVMQHHIAVSRVTSAIMKEAGG